MDTAELNLTLRNVTNYRDWSLDDYFENFRTLYNHFPIFQKVSITLNSIIFALGIIGNGLVIWIAGFRMKKTISAMWFLNLAIADFLCCASLSLRIVDWAGHFSHLFLNCILSMILFNLNMSASIFTLAAMSIDRWVSVMWPIWAKVHRTRKLVRITVAIIWVLSLILTGLVSILNMIDLYSFSEWCSYVSWSIEDYDPHINQITRLVRLIIMFVIPFLIILISYASIFFKLRKSMRPQRSQRPYRIITAVILCFFICWSPYYIWPLTHRYYRQDVYFWIVNIISINLAYLNSCINPIIYVFMGQDFQHSFLRSIPIRLERALSEQPNDQCEEQEDCEPARTTGV